MNLWYNGVDIYDNVSVNYCVHEMFAEKHADTLVIRFNDTKGVWSKWKPQPGDTVRFKEGASDTGKMYLHSLKPENGLFTLRALSVPRTAKTKKSKSWEGVRFLQLGREFAGNHGLGFRNYGCSDQVYPYIQQRNESDFAFFSNLCMLEGCEMLVYDGVLITYDEKILERRAPAGSLSVDENGIFSYRDIRDTLYGSCEIASGIFTGSFMVAGGPVLRPRKPVPVTSDAEAARFAKGMLRDVNKFGRTGQFSKSLTTGYAAASLVKLQTQKASMWDGTVFIYKVRHDYSGNKTTLYFRDVLEGY